MTAKNSNAQYLVEDTPASCEHCGDSFYPKAWGRRMRFCCRACREAWWNEKRHPPGVPQTVKCEECGAEFIPSKHTSTRAKYCSDECRKPSQEQRLRRSWLKRHYSITLEEYDAMMEAQGGRCAICGTDDAAPHRYLSVDHDHDSGEIRGLLCNRCNVGIGRFGDDAELLRHALAYLERP